MDPKTVLAHVRQLCDDIDAARPVRYGIRRIVLPFAVPAALGFGIGIAGCWASASLAEICDNGVDDDANGLVDCDDEACETDEGCLAAVPGCEPRVEYCEDGIDNNGNGNTDCADQCCEPFCDYSGECVLYMVPFEPFDSEIDCDDARDEDCDGQTDCCDPDCADDPLCVE
jgi:hypothetical protein